MKNGDMIQLLHEDGDGQWYVLQDYFVQMSVAKMSD